jgi:hypothetical protein
MKERFIGAWKLVEYVVNFEGQEEEFFPYGKDPKGYLIYTSDYVSVHVMRSERVCNEAPIEEKIEAAENYGGYVGRYEISGDTVIHYPEVCGFVSFLQVSQVRQFQFIADQLILECPYYKEAEGHGRSRLVWQKSVTA